MQSSFRIRRHLELLREREPELQNADDLFAAVLELAEYVAAREHQISARRLEMEPDRLAARIFSNPEDDAIRAIDQILGGLSDEDVDRLENVLFSLERRHGVVRETKPNHRILADGAVLGRVAFTYNRKFKEVLAARNIHGDGKAANVFPELLHRVDDIFPRGRPRYLWRLGPEFGTDRNIEHLLERGDDFIVRSLYRSRARRLARSVSCWSEVEQECFIGENCRDLIHRYPARVLIVRWREGRRQRYGSLVTNLSNVPWEEIYRFYVNRSCKKATEVSQGQTARRRLAASFIILTLFTYRNFRSWAWATETTTTSTAPTAVALSSATERHLDLVEAKRPAVMDRMAQIIDYFHTLTATEDTLPGVYAWPKSMSYFVYVAEREDVPLMDEGTVVHVDLERRLIVVDHGDGVTTTYARLGAVAADVVVGASLPAGHSLGTLAGDRYVEFEPRLAAKYLDHSLQPSVAEILSGRDSLLFDPMSLFTSYDGSLNEASMVPLLGDNDQRTPSASSLADADIYRFRSPDLASETVFPALASLMDEIDLQPLPNVFDDDIEVDVLGEDIS